MGPKNQFNTRYMWNMWFKNGGHWSGIWDLEIKDIENLDTYTKHAKRLFLSGNWDMDFEMSGQFIGTNSLNKGV